MMQVSGEEGVSVDDFITFQKGFFIDMVYLQQDAFDKVDCSCPLERQKEALGLVEHLINTEISLEDKNEIKKLFNKLTGIFKNINYAVFNSAEYKKYVKDYNSLISANAVAVKKAA